MYQARNQVPSSMIPRMTERSDVTEFVGPFTSQPIEHLPQMGSSQSSFNGPLATLTFDGVESDSLTASQNRQSQACTMTFKN